MQETYIHLQMCRTTPFFFLHNYHEEPLAQLTGKCSSNCKDARDNKGWDCWEEKWQHRGKERIWFPSRSAPAACASVLPPRGGLCPEPVGSASPVRTLGKVVAVPALTGPPVTLSVGMRNCLSQVPWQGKWGTKGVQRTLAYQAQGCARGQGGVGSPEGWPAAPRWRERARRAGVGGEGGVWGVSSRDRGQERGGRDFTWLRSKKGSGDSGRVTRWALEAVGASVRAPWTTSSWG